jgi:hypothetical protein
MKNISHNFFVEFTNELKDTFILYSGGMGNQVVSYVVLP